MLRCDLNKLDRMLEFGFEIFSPETLDGIFLNPNSINQTVLSHRQQESLWTMSFVVKNWFMFGVAAAIILGYLFPWVGKAGGVLRPEITAKYLAVMAIFLCSGIALQPSKLKAAVFHWRFHLFVQLFSLGVAPVIVTLVVFVIRTICDALGQKPTIFLLLMQGVRTASCMPPPVSSAIILTRLAGGNEAAAVFNSTLGSFLGILFTPMLLISMLPSGPSGSGPADIPMLPVFIKLSSTVVIPLLLGQGLRAILGSMGVPAEAPVEVHHIPGERRKHRPFLTLSSVGGVPYGVIGSCNLLFIIFTVFCEFFATNTPIGFPEVSATLTIISFTQLLLISIIFLVSDNVKWLGFTAEDTVAAMYTASHKSITLGVPLLSILLGGKGGDSRALSYYSIPLLMWHPLQILIGTALTSPFNEWMRRRQSIKARAN